MLGYRSVKETAARKKHPASEGEHCRQTTSQFKTSSFPIPTDFTGTPPPQKMKKLEKTVIHKCISCKHDPETKSPDDSNSIRDLSIA